MTGLSIRRVLAPNPGPFTGPGTNTYVIGAIDEVVVLDPGPIDDAHVEAIMATVGDRRISAVVVTHTHVDHAPLANPLAADVGAPALGHSPGPGFDPDLRLSDGDVVEVAGRRLVVVHTPGHSDDHCCFRLDDALFTGDHIMGGSSVMVEDMAPYLASLRRLQGTGLRRLLPGHGDEMDEPDAVISWYLAHRMEREAQIVEALRGGAGTVGEIVERVYAEVATDLHPLAARSVAAHLRKLEGEGAVRASGATWDSSVALVGQA